MSSRKDAPGMVRARDLVAYSDAELDGYLEQHRLDDGVAIDVEVEDPENLPESFIQRLRDRARNTGYAARSGAVNLDEVNARLLSTVGHTTHERGASPPYVPGRSPTLPPSPPQGRERENYDELIKQGGRPMYPIAIIDHVANDPTAYRHLLRPWSTSAEVDRPQWWLIFETQLWHWEHFRRWQVHTRSEAPTSYLEVDYSSRWTDVDNAYNFFVDHFRRESLSYSDAASRLLVQYSFTRPVQFHQDPAQQDKLTEWIEYLAFECAIHCRYTRLYQRLQPQRDEAWERIASTGLLRPFETEEDICGIESAYRDQGETDQAERAVRLAKSALKAAQPRPSSRRGSTSTHSPTVSAATSRLDEAQNALQVLKQRTNLIIEFQQATSNFRNRKKDIRRQDHLIQWILNEMPLVEAELRKSSMSGTDPDADTHTTGHEKGHDQERPAVPPKGARKRGCDETLTNDESLSKRLKTGDQQVMDAGEARASELPRRLRQRRHASTSDLPAANASSPVPLRRSARIAARQQARNQPQSQPGATLFPVSGGPRRTTQASAPRRTHGSPSSKASGHMAETTKPNKRSKRRRCQC